MDRIKKIRKALKGKKTSDKILFYACMIALILLIAFGSLYIGLWVVCTSVAVNIVYDLVKDLLKTIDDVKLEDNTETPQQTIEEKK